MRHLKTKTRSKKSHPVLCPTSPTSIYTSACTSTPKSSSNYTSTSTSTSTYNYNYTSTYTSTYNSTYNYTYISASYASDSSSAYDLIAMFNMAVINIRNVCVFLPL